MQSEIAEIPMVFQRILNREDEILEIALALRASHFTSVLILARGTSDNAAHFLKYLIETQLGIPCGLTSPSAVTVYRTALHFQGCLVVAISQSGKSPDLVEYALASKSGGAHVVAMTNDSQSPLATVANSHIELAAFPELAVAATKSYAAELFISLLLVMHWTNSFGRGQFQALIDEAERLVSIEDLLRDSVTMCDINSEIVILGRGFSYPNAKEAALKIQETSHISVQGMSTADYMHGPISALNSNSQVFLISPAHQPINLMTDALESIRARLPKIIWFGSGAQAISGESVVLGSQCENEMFSSVADAILIQRFARDFAIKNNFNPDKPEGLTKVTLTR